MTRCKDRTSTVRRFTGATAAQNRYRGLPILVIAVSCIAALYVAAVPRSPLTGRWYMGTAAGFDCNLEILPGHALTVRYGGCFYRGPLMRSTWRLEGDRLMISDPALRIKLGPYLEVVRCKNYLILVPQSEQRYIVEHGYNRAHCFWPNQLEGGLQ